MILCKEIFQPGVPGETMLNIQASNRLALAALAVVLTNTILAVVQRRRPSALRSLVCAGIGAAFLPPHPASTIPTDTGDCGVLRYLSSWAVLGVELLLVGVQLAFLVWRPDAASPDRADYDDRLR